MVAAIAWATIITLFWMANVINQRIAHGIPREVDLSEEVIVITGGASGLGLLISEVYGMRGATVAVLDVNEMENTESRGVTYYKCDVGNKEQVAKVALQIEKDVSWQVHEDVRIVANPYLSLVRRLYLSTTPPLSLARLFWIFPWTKSTRVSQPTFSDPSTA